MQKLSSAKLLEIFTVLLSLLLAAKLISLAIWYYLPSEGVELNAKKSYQAKYQRVNFSNMLVYSKVTDTYKEVNKVTSTSFSINSLILKGLYGTRSSGFAIVAKKSAPKKTSIIEIGEVFAGYKLKEIELKQVIFTKNSKDFVLTLEEISKVKASDVVRKVRKKVIQEGEATPVSKKDINYYSKNPSKIWKDIAIREVKKNGKITGFKVNRIKKNSKIAELGLEVGDIIIRANNIELKSYNDAIKLYKDIDNIKTLELVVLRNNQEREIIYEIH